MSIILNQLTKRYGQNLVVNNVSLEVEDGELFVLLGGSGSGKSTILRMIAGLTTPDEGRIGLNGRNVTHLSPQARGTGFVFQNYSIFRHMTVAQNVEFGLRIRQAPLEERRQRSAELLELVGLTGLGERYADQLSGGQQQRVALARALAYRPEVLLLDEPFGALDVKIRVQLRRSLREIQQQLQVTTILVTHDQDEAFELADRIGVMDHGRLIEVGAAEQLYHRPQTEFTATFIGGGNVLVGQREGDQIRLGETRLPLPTNVPPHEDGAPIRILFRPETVVLQPEPFSPAQGVLPIGQGEVKEQSFAGSWQRLVLAVERLRGVRPLTPRPAYGQTATHIEAVLPSDPATLGQFARGQLLWLGLRRFHVLNPGGLKLLICTGDGAGGGTAVAVGGMLGEAAGGPVTLLTAVEPTARDDLARQELERIRPAWQSRLPQLRTLVRQGPLADTILAVAQEGHYEMVVVDRRGPSPWTGLVEAGIPVLLVHDPRPAFERILICTGAGEPGKSDIRFGGRVARHTRAAVTLFHVRLPQAPASAVDRIDRHLAQGAASLRALGVTATSQVAEHASFTEAIVAEAEQGDYDLVVLGAPAPRAPQQLLWTNLTSAIVDHTQRPILVVPMTE